MPQCHARNCLMSRNLIATLLPWWKRGVLGTGVGSLCCVGTICLSLSKPPTELRWRRYRRPVMVNFMCLESCRDTQLNIISGCVSEVVSRWKKQLNWWTQWSWWLSPLWVSITQWVEGLHLEHKVKKGGIQPFLPDCLSCNVALMLP